MSDHWEASNTLGIDIGGTTMTAGLVDAGGNVLDRTSMPSPATISGDAVVDAVEALLRRWPTSTCVGIGTAGVIDPRTGAIGAASDSFHHWAGYPLRAAVEQATGLPVVVENDVNAFLIGERAFGSVGHTTDCLGVMLGTGVGAAVVLDGVLRHGPHGAAAELGHMPGSGNEPCTCGGRGHLETIAAGRALARRYEARTGMEAGTVDGARGVAARADDGDEQARDVFHEAGLALGLVLVQAATMFDLDTVVVGGGVASSWDLLQPGVASVVRRHPLISGADLDVRVSSLGEDAVMIGAAHLAMQAMDRGERFAELR